MKKQITLAALALAGSLLLGGCGQDAANSGKANTQQPGQPGANTTQAKTKGTPLPDSAFKATISAVNPPATLAPGQQATIQVKLKNNSDATWPAAGETGSKYQVNLGNHWLDQKDKPVVIDDARAQLPSDLKPGAEIELPITVTAPPKPGDYTLQLDIVQENVAWSQDKGNATYKVKVQVK